MPDWTELRKALLADNVKSVLPPSVKLPILPKALMDFRKKTEDPDADTHELSQIIASDTGLSAELLKNVNSCGSGVRNKITSVKQALVTLGIRSTTLFLTTSSMNQMMRASASKLINFQNFWNTNLERALFAQEIAKLLKADTDLAFTGGMLQDFLLPLITNQLLTEYLEFTENRNDYNTLIEFEQQKFSWNHAEAAAHVMYTWEFPDELICCVFLHHRGMDVYKDPALGKTSVAAVALSSYIPDALRQETDSLEKLIEIEKNWPEFDLQTLAETVDANFNEVAKDVKNHFSFLRAYQNYMTRAQAAS